MDMTTSASGQLITIHLQTVWLIAVLVVIILVAFLKKQ